MNNLQVAETGGVRLFIKNTGHSKPERARTVADSCSLLVRETLFQGS